MAAATPAGVAAEDAQALVAVLAPLSKDATRATFELYARAVVKASSREADYLHLPPTSSSSGPVAQTAPPPETVLTLFEALMSACKQPFDSELLRKQLHSALRNALKESGLGWPRSGAKSFFYSYDGVICEDFGNHLRALALRDPANQSDLDDMESLLRGTALHARKRSILDLLSRAKLSFQPVMRPHGWRRSAASADGQQQQEQPPPSKRRRALEPLRAAGQLGRRSSRWSARRRSTCWGSRSARCRDARRSGGGSADAERLEDFSSWANYC
jgi:hypothetical protein